MRKEKGLSINDLAGVLGLKYRVVYYYETGERKPDYEGLIKIADFFDVSLDYLTGRSDLRGGSGPDQLAAGQDSDE